jgi:hypothetical protein
MPYPSTSCKWTACGRILPPWTPHAIRLCLDNNFAFISFTKGVKTCPKDHVPFTDADNDVVPVHESGVQEIQFNYKKASENVFHFDLGTAGSTSSYSGRFSPEHAFTKEGYKWLSGYDNANAITATDDTGTHTGTPQSIFFRFHQPQTIVRIAFTANSVETGPTKFDVFASNAQDCLDEAQWTLLLEEDNNLR